MPKNTPSGAAERSSTSQRGSLDNKALVLLRGGGDLASGIALRLHRAGIKVLITELPQPLAVRRAVSFGEAVYEGIHTVEGITARLVEKDRVYATLEAGEIPVLIDPEASILRSALHFPVVIDARLLKAAPQPLPLTVPLHIGLGPGFQAGVNCHAAIETRRSHTLGRVYWKGTTQADSGQPEGDPRRVLRAAADGVLAARAEIGEHVAEGQVVAVIGKQVEVISPLKGVLRGLIRNGIHVTQGLKIGDVDPRDDARACYLISDKALAIGGGVLEAILTKMDIRKQLW
jgi:xanthine dehydrogenase accessory factor